MNIDKETVKEVFNRFKSLKVLIIGETIIDDYFFVRPNGIAIKDPIISVEFIKKERYLGGVLATARHISQFVDKVHVITLLGEKEENKDFINNSIKSNISCSFFVKPGSRTIVKQRFIDSYRLIKLFKMEYLDNTLLTEDLKKSVLNKIDSIYKEYDIILINDLGHGFLTKDMIDQIVTLKKFLCVSIQTKNSNYGFNLITKCDRADFLSLNQLEIRLLFQNKRDDFESLLKKLIGMKKYKEIMLTLGKNGVMFYRNKINHAPALVTNPVDTIGAGDAVFGISSLMSFLNIDEKIIPEIANASGAVAVQYVGNKESVTLENILKYFN